MDLIMNLMINLVEFLIMIIPVLISVAYLTLGESKMLGYSQSSKGPNVVGIYGLLQPLADGVKLFSKEMMMPNHVNMFLYLWAPMLALTLALVSWSLAPLGGNMVLVDMEVTMILMFALSTMGVYAMLVSGWSSNSKYAFLGALSAAAQMMSYEVCMGLIMMNIILCMGTFNLSSIIKYQHNSIWFLFPLLFMAFMFFMCSLAETNSAPFDLTEGESEIVSGYNMEYSSMSFALFFLAEYSHMMFMSYLFVVMFMGGGNFFMLSMDLLLYIKLMFLTFVFIWVSTSFPSLSYDQLMYLLWKSYLPLSIGLVLLTNSILWSFLALPKKVCI